MRAALTAILICASASQSLAEAPLFKLPIDCALGENCFIQNYVDTDPTEGHRDFSCGGLSYDGHKGTDVRLATRADMERGFNVLASADGIVVAIRDGMADIASNAPNAPELEGRDCGNGLVINHGDGWETQYCHMQRGSLVVSVGDSVAAGDPLGRVGLSGRTEFPHIHMSIRKDGEVIDPFAPDAVPGTCNPKANATLWETPIPYQPGALLDAGFSGGVPEFDQIKQGLSDPESLAPDAGGLVLWGYAFGTRKGDTMRFSIEGPNGWRHDQLVEFTKPQAQLFRASGRKRPAAGWPVGMYQGTVTLERGDEILGEQSLRVTISR